MSTIRNLLAYAGVAVASAGAALVLDHWNDRNDREVIEYVVTQDDNGAFNLSPFNNFRQPLESWRNKIPGIDFVDWDGNNQLDTDEVRDYVFNAFDEDGDGELTLEEIEKIGRIAKLLWGYDEDTHQYLIPKSHIPSNINYTAKAFHCVYQQELAKYNEREEARIKTRLEERGKEVPARPDKFLEPGDDRQQNLERELRKLKSSQLQII